MKENYVKYGKYNITINVKKKIYTQLQTLVKQRTTIVHSGKGELKFELTNEDINDILEYEVEHLTNIRGYTDKSVSELLKCTEDEDLVKTMDYLNKIMLGFVHQCKESVIEKLREMSQIKERNH